MKGRHPMTKTDQLTAVPAQAATDYQKTLRVSAPAEALFEALTTVAGLAGWWTRVTGSGEAGGVLEFFFDPPDPCVMHVDEATRPTFVQWTVTACFLADWVGTRPTFTIAPIGEGECELHFRHHGLTSALECIEDCTRGWDHFLVSLRQYAEVGRGMPVGSSGDQARRR